LLGEDDSRLIDSLMLDCARGTGAIGLPGKQAETWREWRQDKVGSYRCHG